MARIPLISIITITYNAEATIGATIASVKMQNFNDYEHIVIDGASSDGTVAIARGMGVDKVISEPDEGLYYAMNKGLAKAAGEYVVFLNAGDRFADADVLSDYSRAIGIYAPDIVYADTDIVDGAGKVVGHRHFSVPDRLTVGSFASGMKVCHQAFMVKRSLAPFYDTRYRFSADYDWCIRCMKNSRLPEGGVNLHRVAIHYLREGITTRNRRRSLMERFRIMTRYYGLLPTTLRHIKKVFSR